METGLETAGDKATHAVWGPSRNSGLLVKTEDRLKDRTSNIAAQTRDRITNRAGAQAGNPVSNSGQQEMSNTSQAPWEPRTELSGAHGQTWAGAPWMETLALFRNKAVNGVQE